MGPTPFVVCVSNDVMPGSTIPVAAPGLRTFGLAEGLRAHGYEVQSLVVKSVLGRVWRAPVPLPCRPGTMALDGPQIQRYLEARRPVVAILTNSNQADNVRPVDGLHIVYDFFAPKMLELEAQEGGPDEREMHDLRRRKLRGLAAADGVIVNGSKKLSYVGDWLRQAGRDPATIPLEVVNMCVPPQDGSRPPQGERTAELRFGMAGYLQSWSLPGRWVEQIEPLLESRKVTLEVLTPQHWGGGQALATTSSHDRLSRYPGVRSRQALGYTAYRRFLRALDVVIDLFDYTAERELAMVTRTVVALSCGVPVVHPPFTEVSPLIERYDAGWLLDPSVPDAVGDTLADIAEDRAVVEDKAANARRLAREVIDPAAATAPLARMIARWAG